MAAIGPAAQRRYAKPDAMRTYSSLVLVMLVLIALWANTSYLASGTRVNLWYVSNILIHLGLGLALVGMFAVRGRELWLSARAKHGFRVHWTAVLLFLTFVSGVALVVVGQASQDAQVVNQYSVWFIHTVAGIAFSCGVIVVWNYPILRFCLGAALAVPVVSHIIDRPESNRGLNSVLAPAVAADEVMGGEEGPFFPSAAETADGRKIPASFFMGSEECGRCHTDIYEQWTSSAHRRASFNNQWYRKSVEYMQSVVGVEPSKWCGGCHDHALLFTGLMDSPIEEIIDRPEAHAGLSCTSCHSITRIKNTMGNAGFVIEYPKLHDLATSDNSVIRSLHDFIVHIDPEPHRKAFLKPLHTGDSSAFCSSCHKVHLDKPVNHYRWLRGFNSYDNWQASGVSGDGARSFYYPDEPSTCKDCHMPLIPGEDPASAQGLIRSHRFAAANTALPTAYGDEAQKTAVEDFLKAGQVSVDLFALVRTAHADADVEFQPMNDPLRLASTFAVGEEAEMSVPSRMASTGSKEEITAPIDQLSPALIRGESVRLDAVVRTLKVGHFFPGGTVDAFDCWLEVKATDDRGKVFFWSGSVAGDGNGPVERGAHFYRSLMLDARGNPINKRNAWSARSVLYVQLIPPGAANTVRFRLHVPEDIGDRVTIEAKLNYRKFAWWHTQWAYAGVRKPGTPSATQHFDDGEWEMVGDLTRVSGPLKAIPDVPIVTMATAKVELPVIGPTESMDAAPDAGEPTATDRARWNDYGIGLFLQGDLRGAENAFQRVREIEPEYADGWVNLARVRMQEGDLDEAQQALSEALSLKPNLAKAHYFYGLSWKNRGDYDRALTHFRRAARSYPKDRVVQNQIGRIHFLKREYRLAVHAFEKTLRIDPEDLEAHYNLMLSYRGLGDVDRSQQHRERYLRFKADESAQEITGDYRLTNPEDNKERLPIHEHVSDPSS